MRFVVQRYSSVPGNEDGVDGEKNTVMSNTTDMSIDPDSSTSDGTERNIRSVARRGRLYAKRYKRRLVYKDGECNVSHVNISERKRKYFADIFTTLLDMKWRYNILLFTAAFVISWVVFAFIWWAICVLHNDHLHADDADWTPCMTNVHDFATALLFSVETQHTIGYGYRMMEPKCAEAVVLLMIQSCCGVFIQSLMTGLIFAKLSRPKRRGYTIMFSRSGVICLRDGVMCLLFRVADMRKSHIVGATLHAMIIKNKMTEEGEFLPLCQEPLQLETDNSTDSLFMLWPVTAIHRIDKDSPLWELSAEDLLRECFEIVVMLEGTVESTGMTTQVRSSYLPSEILWGHHLSPLMTYQKDNGQYQIDYSMFHNTVPVPQMPECSAKALSEKSKSRHCRHTHSDDCECLKKDVHHSVPQFISGGPSKGRHMSVQLTNRKYSTYSTVSDGNVFSPKRYKLYDIVRAMTSKNGVKGAPLEEQPSNSGEGTSTQDMSEASEQTVEISPQKKKSPARGGFAALAKRALESERAGNPSRDDVIMDSPPLKEVNQNSIHKSPALPHHKHQGSPKGKGHDRSAFKTTLPDIHPDRVWHKKDSLCDDVIPGNSSSDECCYEGFVNGDDEPMRNQLENLQESVL